MSTISLTSMRPPLNTGEILYLIWMSNPFLGYFNEAPAEHGGNRGGPAIPPIAYYVTSMRPPLNTGEIFFSRSSFTCSAVLQ